MKNDFSNLQETKQAPKKTRLDKQLDGLAAVPALKKKENKGKRFNMLMKLSTFERLQAEAEKQHFSVNGFVNKLVEDYLDGQLDYTDKYQEQDQDAPELGAIYHTGQF